MPISRDEVEHVARLAHIGLSEDEIDSMTVELSSVLDHVVRLQQVDTAGVPPTAQTIPTTNVMRDDVVRQSWSAEQVLANAPREADGFFEVQAVFE